MDKASSPIAYSPANVSDASDFNHLLRGFKLKYSSFSVWPSHFPRPICTVRESLTYVLQVEVREFSMWSLEGDDPSSSHDIEPPDVREFPERELGASYTHFRVDQR
jgi:hypothetical protein